MTREEAIADLKEALKEIDTFRKIYSKQRKVSVEYEKRYESLSFAIKALEQLSEKPDYIDLWNVGAILKNIPKQPEMCNLYEGVCGYPIEACSECPKHTGWRPLKEQQPCEDCISREYLLDRWFIVFNDDGVGLRVVLKKDIEDAPSVATQRNNASEIIRRIEQARDKDKNAGEYPYNRCIEIIKEAMKLTSGRSVIK